MHIFARAPAAYYNNGGTITIKDSKQSANNASAAGCIMLCITNFALIIFVGLGEINRIPAGYALSNKSVSCDHHMHMHSTLAVSFWCRGVHREYGKPSS